MRLVVAGSNETQILTAAGPQSEGCFAASAGRGRGFAAILMENMASASASIRQGARTVVHLIEGGEGYGMATVLRQIARYFPCVKFMALGSGKMASELPPDMMLWVGPEGMRLNIGKSTVRGLAALAARVPRFWRVAGAVAINLPHGPVLLHCHNIFTALLAGLVRFRSRSSDIKILFHFHGTMNRHRLFSMLPALQRFLVGHNVDGIVAVSKAVADYWKPAACPVWVVHNGIEPYTASRKPAYYQKRAGTHDILLAGSLSREKGHLIAVEAMHLLGTRVSEFHLWLAGGPIDPQINPFVRELTEAIQEYDLEAHVTVLGEMADLRDLAPLAWLGLQQRITAEPFGLWTMEAMFAGLPVVASRTGGTPELVRHECEGLLVPPGNPRAVADAILRLADDEALRDRLSAGASQRARLFGIDQFVTKMGDVYNKLGVSYSAA